MSQQSGKKALLTYSSSCRSSVTYTGTIGDEGWNAGQSRAAELCAFPLPRPAGPYFLSPVIQHEEAGPAVARLVRPVHRHHLRPGAKAACQHLPVGFLAR